MDVASDMVYVGLPKPSLDDVVQAPPNPAAVETRNANSAIDIRWHSLPNRLKYSLDAKLPRLRLPLKMRNDHVEDKYALNRLIGE